jgi:GNAT superfamily N-acetyltransferase
MAAYRFCRSDDVPLLVRAYNECYRVHFPERPQMTTEELRRLMLEQNLWTSSCMVASSGDRPVGVLLAAKRPEANRVLALGVHPDHRRQGHGRHLLTSLGQKLAILGPRRMLAELPAELEVVGRFLEACGYVAEASYTDFVARPERRQTPPNELIFPVTIDDLLDAGALEEGAERCWERSTASLINTRERVRGMALGSGERIEAYLLYHEPPGEAPREILAMGCADVQHGPALLGLLFERYCGSSDRQVRIRRVGPEEIDHGLLASWGFAPAERTVRYAAEAVPA